MFYVYIHRRASDNSVFYVGKGSKYRAYETHRSKRSIHWLRIFEKHGRVVEIVKSGLTEKEALDLEITLIAQYAMENLCNHSLGGESGGSGRIWTEESRKKLSESKKGKKQPWAGHSLTEEGRERIRRSKLGRPVPWATGENSHTKRQEYRDYLSERCKGVPRPDLVGASNPSARSVVCVDTGFHFDTMKDAVLWLISIGKNKAVGSNISSACSGKLNSAYGFRWEYTGSKPPVQSTYQAPSA